MATRKDFERWSFWWKLASAGLGGLSFWKRDSGGGLNLVARHWEHLACWSWVVSVDKPRHGEARHLFWLYHSPHFETMTVDLLGVRFRVQWQDHYCMAREGWNAPNVPYELTRRA